MKMTSLLLLPLLTGGLAAQDSASDGADPYARGDATSAPGAPNPASRNFSMCYEVFSLPLAQAAAYQREQIDDSEIYRRLVQQLEKGAAQQETLAIMRLMSGMNMTSEAIVEHIYPTSFETPELPNTVGLGIAMQSPKEGSEAPDPQRLVAAEPVATVEGLRTPATPTDFETRNGGVALEVIGELGEDDGTYLLNMACEQVTLVDQSISGQEFSEVKMPEFECRKIRGQFRVTLNRPFLIGTLNRPAGSKADPGSANRVWFAFVTVNRTRS